MHDPIVKIGTLRLVEKRAAAPRPLFGHSRAPADLFLGHGILCVACIVLVPLIAMAVFVSIAQCNILPLVLMALAVVTIVPFLFRSRPPYCVAGLRHCASPRCGCPHDKG